MIFLNFLNTFKIREIPRNPDCIRICKYEAYIWYIWCRRVAQQHACLLNLVLTACQPSARSVLAQNCAGETSSDVIDTFKLYETPRNLSSIHIRKYEPYILYIRFRSVARQHACLVKFSSSHQRGQYLVRTALAILHVNQQIYIACSCTTIVPNLV